MALPEELEELLACPRCKGRIEHQEEAGELHCHACRLAFTIDDGIPVMLLEEARTLDGEG